jgi:AraC-like DNA-binding protein
MKKLQYDMDKSETFIDRVNPQSFQVILNQQPFKQSQGPNWPTPKGNFPDYDLFVCYGGSARFSFHDGTYEVTRGTGILIRPNETIEVRRTSSENFDAVAQHFDLKLFETIDYLSFIKLRRFVHFSRWPFVAEAMDRYAEYSNNRVYRLLRYHLFFAVLTEFIYDAYIEEETEIDHKSLTFINIAHAIESGIDEPDILERALQSSPFSREYTIRQFKKYFKLTPKQFLIQTRVSSAKDYLMQGYSVKETASLIGIQDEFYFSRLFSRHMNMSPMEFKMNQGVR